MFNKILKTDEKQEGLLKRLKNIEDKTDNQLKVIKDNKDSQLGIKSIGYQSKKNYHKKQKICLKNTIIKKNLLITKSFILKEVITLMP